MTAWLVYDAAGAVRNRTCIDFYFEEAAARGLTLTLYIEEKLSAVCGPEGLSVQYEGRTLEKPDFVIYRARELSLHRHIEAMGIPTFNSARVSRVCNDKFETYRLAAALGIPMLETHLIYDKKAGPGVPYPAVIKPCGGHGGAGVALVRSDAEFAAAADTAGYPCLIQPEANCPGRDVRVYILGHTIRIAMLRRSDTDFRANFCLGGKAEVYTLSPEERRMVQKLADALDFGFAGIDFIFQDGKLVFNEIEDVVGARMLYACTDIRIVGEYLDWILAQMQRP